MGWATLNNGDLLSAAEKAYDVFITTDKNLRYQQNLADRKLAVLILPTTSWPEIQKHADKIITAVAGLKRGDYLELNF